MICEAILSVIILNAIILRVVKLSSIMLSVIMLGVVIMNVIVLSGRMKSLHSFPFFPTSKSAAGFKPLIL